MTSSATSIRFTVAAANQTEEDQLTEGYFPPNAGDKYDSVPWHRVVFSFFLPRGVVHSAQKCVADVREVSKFANQENSSFIAYQNYSREYSREPIIPQMEIPRFHLCWVIDAAAVSVMQEFMKNAAAGVWNNT